MAGRTVGVPETAWSSLSLTSQRPPPSPPPFAFPNNPNNLTTSHFQVTSVTTDGNLSDLFETGQ